MPIRMYEQLRAVWRTKDKEQPFVRGFLKTKRDLLNGESGSGRKTEIVERWFTLLGHSLFFCVHRDSVEYGGALLTDLFSPVIARVDEDTHDSFHATSTQQAFNLYLKGVLMADVDVLICPSSAEEKRWWLERLQQAGLKVPTRQPSNKCVNGRDGRKKVVIIEGDVNDSLYLPQSQRESPTSPDRRVWKHQWKIAARKVLSLPDAAQIRMKYEVLEKLVASEQRYLDDLKSLVDVYYKPFKTAVASGHVAIPWTKLESIFLNCDSLLTFHKVLLSQMKTSIVLPNPNFGQLFLHIIPHMNIYVEFVKSQGQANKVLEECLLNPSFTDFLENHHSSHDCEAQQLKMLLQQPVGRLEIYQAFIEEVLKLTSESHCDYSSLGTVLQDIEDMKKNLIKRSSSCEREERILGILRSVGVRGFVLLEPDCTLVLEDEMYLPAATKWTTGTIKQRKVHCYLYTKALAVIGLDRKVRSRSQVFPLSGATIYEHVSRTGEVTYAKDPEVEIRALKLYSPDGPRNGVVIIFLTQSGKSLWLSKISQMIALSTPADRSSPTSSPAAEAINILTPSPLTPTPQSYATSRRSSIATSLPVYTPKTIQTSPDSTPSHSRLRPKLSNSTTNLSTAGSSGSKREASLVSSVDLLKMSHSNSAQQRGIPRSLSMFSVPAATADAPPVQPKAVRDYYSISSLFSLLTTNPPDPRYPATFLLTYRMFTNAHEVLDALIDEHRRGLDGRTPFRTSFSVSSESLRFFNTLKIWVNKYYVDFHHDVTLKQLLMVYLDSIKVHEYIHPKERELVDNILRTVNTRGHIPLIRKSKLKIQVPKAVSSIPDSLLSVPVEQLARQLTWMEHEIYSRIKPYEFLQQKWTKKNRLELAPNICYVISRFNEVTLWLAKEVLSPEHPRKRCAVIQHLIQVTRHCLELGNFVTVFQITGALCSSSIQRLKKTWDYLPHYMWESFQELKALTTVEGGSKVYRLRQKSSPSPSIPYIGPYLNLLVSIEVGMPTFVKDPPEHVNFLKLTKLAAVIEEVTRFQNPKYSIPADGAILIYLEQQLESSKEFDDDQRYSRSIAVEPKHDPRSRKKSLSKLLSGHGE